VAGRASIHARSEALRRFSEEIRKLRLRSGQPTIKHIAEKSGYSPTTISDVLNGKRFLSVDVAKCIVVTLGYDFSEVSQLWFSLSESVHNEVPLVPVGVQDGLVSATWYRNNGEFYSAARQSVDSATEEIRATYVRQYSPDDVSSKEAAEYFESVLKWAEAPGVRSVNRIFGVPIRGQWARERVLNYLRQHRREIEERHLRNYQVRVYEYTAGGDGLNMVLFDREVSFIAVSARGPQQLTGMRLDDETFTRYLVEHFDQLLAGSELLADYLDGVGRRG
jgi:transcriptional regulator with XRE-family HTH domain